MQTGKVLRFGNRGYGWIHVSNSRQAVFFHIKDVTGRLILQEGDAVEFEAVSTERGPKATLVKLITPVALQGGAL